MTSWNMELESQATSNQLKRQRKKRKELLRHSTRRTTRATVSTQLHWKTSTSKDRCECELTRENNVVSTGYALLSLCLSLLENFLRFISMHASQRANRKPGSNLCQSSPGTRHPRSRCGTVEGAVYSVIARHPHESAVLSRLTAGLSGASGAACVAKRGRAAVLALTVVPKRHTLNR